MAKIQELPDAHKRVFWRILYGFVNRHKYSPTVLVGNIWDPHAVVSEEECIACALAPAETLEETLYHTMWYIKLNIL